MKSTGRRGQHAQPRSHPRKCTDHLFFVGIKTLAWPPVVLFTFRTSLLVRRRLQGLFVVAKNVRHLGTHLNHTSTRYTTYNYTLDARGVRLVLAQFRIPPNRRTKCVSESQRPSKTVRTTCHDLRSTTSSFSTLQKKFTWPPARQE